MWVWILPHSILHMGRRGRPLFLSQQSWDELCKVLYTHTLPKPSPLPPHFLKMCLGKKRCRSIQQPSWKVPLILQEDVSHLCSERLGGLTPDACRSHLGLVFISLFIASPYHTPILFGISLDLCFSPRGSAHCKAIFRSLCLHPLGEQNPSVGN